MIGSEKSRFRTNVDTGHFGHTLSLNATFWFQAMSQDAQNSGGFEADWKEGRIQNLKKKLFKPFKRARPLWIILICKGPRMKMWNYFCFSLRSRQREWQKNFPSKNSAICKNRETFIHSNIFISPIIITKNGYLSESSSSIHKISKRYQFYFLGPTAKGVRSHQKFKKAIENRHYNL